MHIQGDKLYTIDITGHVICDILIDRNGLNPSLDKTSITLKQSSAKYGCNLSKSSHARPSAGCLNFPSLERFSSCHLKESAVFDHINNLLSLETNEKCLKVFAELKAQSHYQLKEILIYREASQV